jgi:hypothetical protein
VCGVGTNVAHVDRANVVVGREKALFRFITNAEFAPNFGEPATAEIPRTPDWRSSQNSSSTTFVDRGRKKREGRDLT